MRLRAALDLVLEREWTTVAQLAAVGGVQECTVRRWRRGANPPDDLNAVTRWLAGPIDTKARMAFAVALIAGTDLQITCSSQNADVDGDGEVTPHDSMTALLEASQHLLDAKKRVSATRPVTADDFAATQHHIHEVARHTTAAMQAMAAVVGQPRRGGGR